MSSDSGERDTETERPNTDDADWRTVLRELAYCADCADPETRLVGNIRAGDIFRACAVAVMQSKIS